MDECEKLCGHCCYNEGNEEIRELRAKVERLLELIQVHVDPTGFEDDPDMQMAMREVAALEGEQDGA